MTPAKATTVKKAAKRPTKRTLKRVESKPDPERIGEEYLKARSLREESTKQESRWKSTLMDEVLASQKPDGNGHRFFDLGRPFQLGKQLVKGFKRERRVSQVMDEDKAMALIKKKKLEDECLSTTVVIDEDALLAANYDEKITDKELAAIYTNKETFALILVKDDA